MPGSTTGSRAMVLLAVAIFAPGLVAFLAAVAWLVGSYADPS